MRITGSVSGVKCECLLDTGSSISILHSSVFDALPNVTLKRTSVTAKTASQEDLPLLGRVVVPFQIGDATYPLPLFVSDAIDVPCLLGVDFLQHCPCVIDLSRRRLVMVPNVSVRSVSAQAVSLGNVSLSCDRVIAPGSEMVLQGLVPNCDYVGPALIEPDDVPSGVEVVRAIVNVDRACVPVVVRNVTAEPITLFKKRSLASVEVGFVEQAPELSASTDVDVKKLAKLDQSLLTNEQRQRVHELLSRYADMFDGHIGFTDVVTHDIDTGDHPPIRQAPRRVPPHLAAEVKAQISELVDQGILEESNGTWSSPIVMVRKKNGKFRLVADLRRLNACSKIPVYQIPRIDDTLDALSGSDTFCQLDMNSAYFQIGVSEKDRDKTTITTPFGSYRFRRMIFGLAGGPATCARLLDRVLGDITPKDCVHYFDDIVVHGNGVEDVLAKLDKVLQRLQAAGLTLNLEKCSLFCKEVNFLGHVVSGGGVRADPEKVAKVVDWPVPRTVKELSSFLGLASYFRKFVRNFAEIAAPLFQLTHKDAKFQWGDMQQSAFEQLKCALTSAPVVSFPRFSAGAGRFRLDTDASDTGIGATLFQEQDGEDKVIAFASHRLSKAQRNYSTTRKELLACVIFVQHFRHYLLGRRFELRTDHASLRWLLNFKNPSGVLARWLEILSEYDFEIIFRPGSENVPADVMSRRPPVTQDAATQTAPESVPVMRVSPGSWSNGFLRHEQDQDPAIADIARHMSTGKRPRSTNEWTEMSPRMPLRVRKVE